MSLQEVRQDVYDEETSANGEDAKQGNNQVELVSISSSLMEMTHNDDETFKRIIPKQKVYPQTLDEDDS